MDNQSTRCVCKNGSESNISVTDDSGTVYGGPQTAVTVRNAYKHYGSKSKPNQALNNLNMTVAKGTIYGLLGASGCGKTTLLSCIVGRRKIDSGEIRVLGGKPGTKGSGVPGRRVGYMPQEIALYGEFTTKETMMYFGRIFGMRKSEIEERLRFLTNLLDLAPQDRLVKNLSGGQQRRVSFSIALMHDPELLILDEPTVGVDPLLRQRIWNHLVHLTNNGQKTVIVTTHYIEEARQAHTISLMRFGQLLAEESPLALLSTYRCTNLEEIFLKLSTKQEITNNSVNQLNISNLPHSASVPTLPSGNKKDALVYASQDSGVEGLSFYRRKEDTDTVSADLSTNENFDSNNAPTQVISYGRSDYQLKPPPAYSASKDSHETPSYGKISALIEKNFLRMRRNLAVILFIFILPVVQSILFCLSVGRAPTDLKIAIANMEMNGTHCTFEKDCNLENLSCRYLSHLNSSIVKEFYPNPEAAVNAVRAGHAFAAMHFTENFTDALAARMILARDTDDETLDQSEVQVWLDMSNQQIGLILNLGLQQSYKDFVQALLRECNQNPKLGDIPIQFKDPIYGSITSSYTDFVAPGIILSIVFFFAVILTSSVLIIERTEGLLDRSWVAGVTPFEIVASHIIVQFIVVCAQTTLVLLFMIHVFGITCNGDFFDIVLLTLLQGMCGMCFGFVISVICDLEQHATQLGLGSFYLLLLLCGVVWPLEGMPFVLRCISYCLPLTQATTAMRSLLIRGWGIMEQEVYLGFVSTIAWIVVFLVITMVMMRVRRG